MVESTESGLEISLMCFCLSVAAGSGCQVRVRNQFDVLLSQCGCRVRLSGQGEKSV